MNSAAVLKYGTGSTPRGFPLYYIIMSMNNNNINSGAGGHYSASSGGGGGGSGGGGESLLSASATLLRRQDDLIDELAMGVNRLMNQSTLIGQEAESQVRLLDSMEDNLDMAQDELEDETRRAMRLREEKGLCRLYLVIVALSILLFLLILMSLS